MASSGVVMNISSASEATSCPFSTARQFVILAANFSAEERLRLLTAMIGYPLSDNRTAKAVPTVPAPIKPMLVIFYPFLKFPMEVYTIWQKLSPGDYRRKH
jgi:hypothetical protein